MALSVEMACLVLRKEDLVEGGPGRGRAWLREDMVERGSGQELGSDIVAYSIEYVS